MLKMNWRTGRIDAHHKSYWWGNRRLRCIDSIYYFCKAYPLCICTICRFRCIPRIYERTDRNTVWPHLRLCTLNLWYIPSLKAAHIVRKHCRSGLPCSRIHCRGSGSSSNYFPPELPSACIGNLRGSDWHRMHLLHRRFCIRIRWIRRHIAFR